MEKGSFKRLFTKKQVLTVPNLLSLLRFLMIPLIVWLYLGKQNYYAAVAVIVLSAITDVADGIIARKFNMVSDLGKIIDPIADKCTQAALIICLAIRYKLLIVLICVFAAEEITKLVLGALILKRSDSVNSAKWYGKMTTVLLYATMTALILFPNIPQTVAQILIWLCMAAVLFSFVMYLIFYVKILIKINKKAPENEIATESVTQIGG